MERSISQFKSKKCNYCHKHNYLLFISCFLSSLFLLFITPVFSHFFLYSELLSGKVLSSIDLKDILHSSTFYDVTLYIIANFTLHIFLSGLIIIITLPISFRFNLSQRYTFYTAILLTILISFWIYSTNSLYYPDSIHPSFFSTIDSRESIVTIYGSLTILIIASAIHSVLFFYLNHIKPLFYKTIEFIHQFKKRVHFFSTRQNVYSIIFFSLISLVIISTVISNTRYTSSTTNSPNKPNVIIIGIDSLRPSEIGINSQAEESLMPFTHRFLQNSKLFSTAYTPLARTFPAWTSILTGTYPIKNNVHFNLTNLDISNGQSQVLPSLFKNAGYKTIYATDEKRFSNIDKSFGFDSTIGPPIGFKDFILGKINDLPLNNIISNTFIGKYLFPYSYGNRAASITYNPDSFIDLFQDGIRTNNQKPYFIAVHLCLPHWPYKWHSTNKINTDKFSSYENYKLSLTEVDNQLSNLFDILISRGFLENSLVILLSDHGESFYEDAIKYQSADFDTSNQFIKRQLLGHGTDVLNRTQHKVLLAMQSFGNSITSPGISEQHASLIDIAPTLSSLLNLEATQSRFDGISLIPWLSNNKQYVKRDFYVESGFNVPAILSKTPDEEMALFQGIAHYQITARGRVVLKSSSIPKLLKNKQLAIYSGDLTLALLPKYFNSQPNNVLLDHSTNTIYPPLSNTYTDRNALEFALRNHFMTFLSE